MRFRAAALALGVLFLAGCEAIDTELASRAAMREAIRNEPAGNYFIGRQCGGYRIWGWVRTGQTLESAKLVMLNGKGLAPDRGQLNRQ
jgi:hypothetical protein